MKQEKRKKRLAIAGCGFLGNILMDAWKKWAFARVRDRRSFGAK